MNKSLKNLLFTLVFASFTTPLYASAWSWDAWKNEDEELNFRGVSRKKSSSTNKGNAKKTGASPFISLWKDEDEELNFKKKNKNFNRYKMVSKKQNLNVDKVNNSYDVNDSYSGDYNTKNQSYVSDAEVYNSLNKWKDGKVSVFWENYRGNNIRVEVLRNNSDLKEMRLKFVQSQSINSDPDGSISDMLNIVANQMMKKTCGKKSKQSIILYERPSVELIQETAADDYKVMARGSSIKEYGFRCIY